MKKSSLESLRICLKILRLIPERGKITVKQIVEAIEADEPITERSVQRYLKFLSEELYIDVDARAKPYGYQLPKNSKLLQPALSENESLLLHIAESHLKKIVPPNIFQSQRSLFDIAKNKVNANHKSNKWVKKALVVSDGLERLPPKINNDIFQTVAEALYEDKYLKIDYTNANSEIKINQRIMPLGLIHRGVRIYLVAQFDGKTKQHTLALNRVLKAKMSTLKFSRPAGFNLKNYVDEGRLCYGEGKICKLTFCIDKKPGLIVKESPLSVDQEIVEYADYYEISASVYDSMQLDAWIRSYGDKIWNIDKSVK